MLKKMLLVTSTAAAALGSTAVLADPPHWAKAHGWRAKHQHHHHGHYYAPRPVYVAPRPVYMVPAPRVVYAAPPAPVYYPAPAAVYPAPSVSIRLHLPL